MMVTLRKTLLLAVMVFVARTASADPGILLLAHGGSADWNARVSELSRQVDRTMPTEVAFGMATRAAMKGAMDRLVARGVTEIVAVPLFVSSWSSVITSTEYLLGLRAEAPSALAAFAKMNHAQPAAAGATGHENHAAADGTTPIASSVPVRMTAALNDHQLVADILVSRARSISSNPREEAVIVVAHGPTTEDENRKWLADMKTLASRMSTVERFASIDYMTLRDDAPKPIRDQATAELRDVASRRIAEGRQILIVPLLVSFGGIERGLRERLDGIKYTMPTAALVPDERLVAWVLSMAKTK
jgi:hypothetical protein